MRISQKLTLATVFVVVAVVGMNCLGTAAGAGYDMVDSVSTAALKRHHADEIKKRDAIAKQKALSRYADSVSAIAAQFMASQKPRTEFTVTRVSDPAPANDTTAFVMVKRPADPMPYRVPAFLVEQLARAAEAAAKFFIAWQGELAARVFADTTTIPMLAQADSSGNAAIDAQQNSIKARDDAAHPLCGRRCGAVIGSLITIAALLLAHATVSR